jgi:hypothetical protein
MTIKLLVEDLEETFGLLVISINGIRDLHGKSKRT